MEATHQVDQQIAEIQASQNDAVRTLEIGTDARVAAILARQGPLVEAAMAHFRSEASIERNVAESALNTMRAVTFPDERQIEARIKNWQNGIATMRQKLSL